MSFISRIKQIVLDWPEAKERILLHDLHGAKIKAVESRLHALQSHMDHLDTRYEYLARRLTMLTEEKNA